MTKRIICILILLSIFISIFAVNAFAIEQFDSLVTATANLFIHEDPYSSYAECEFAAICRYQNDRIDATFRLYQNDNDYMCWTYTDEIAIDDSVTYPVTKGHDYFLGMHVKVKDADGNIIDEVIEYTNIVSFY